MRVFQRVQGRAGVARAVLARPLSNQAVVTIDYHDLVAGKDLSAEIDRAYNFEGVGLLTVKNVPKLLPMRSTHAHTHIHTHIHTYTQSHIHTQALTHTHTHTITITHSPVTQKESEKTKQAYTASRCNRTTHACTIQ